MEERMPRPMPAQTVEQKAIFERVWKRVMADREEESPLVWEEPARPEEETGLAPLGAGDPAPEEAEGTTAPATPRPMGPHGDFPRETGVLGESCLDCGPLLQELVRRELTDCREYQALARRAGGSPGRVLAGLAGEKKRRAKRLSAAYFLISGVRYWPEGEGGAAVPSYLGTLRRRFAQEQATMAAYLAGLEGTTDPCLRQMFWEHAQENWGHACQIRKLVENA